MKTLLTSFVGAIATGLLITLPAHALPFMGMGSGILNNGEDNLITFDVTGTSNPSTVSLNIAALTSDTNGNLGNLLIYLRSPSNSQTLFLAQNIADGTTFNNVTFSDEGSTTIGVPSYQNGTFLAIDSASDIEGLADIENFAAFSPVGDGEWSLLIRSFNQSGTDSIGTVTLNITPVPFEFSPAVGLVALGAVWAFKQTRKKKG
jgi:hypothetical protein